MKIPHSELEECATLIRARPKLFDPRYVADAYRTCGLEVVADPFSAQVVAPIAEALRALRPYSMVRIGDGEANLLTYGAYPGTPNLDRAVVEQIVAMQSDSFVADPPWMVLLRELLWQSILYADMVGVVGVWRPKRPDPVEESRRAAARILEQRDVRGVSGQWRGRDWMLQLAARGVLDRKILVSAHVYFAFLQQLQPLMALARTVYLLTDREAVVARLAGRHPRLRFEHVAVGRHGAAPAGEGPRFLPEVHAALPADMRGCLGLVGAGPWAEIYCTWIKQRGGVAVDIGSAFDLLDGESTRPVHGVIPPGMKERLLC